MSDNKNRFTIFAPFSNLYGYTHSLEKILVKLCGGNRIIDLLFVLPNGFINRKEINNLENVQSGDHIACKMLILKHQFSNNFSKFGKKNYKVYGSVGKKAISLVFFNINRSYLQRTLLINKDYAISGKIELYAGHWQITHPDYIGNPEKFADLVGYKPIYPLTNGLNQKQILSLLYWPLRHLSEVPEWLSVKTLGLHKEWCTWTNSLRQIHNPKNSEDLLPNNPHRTRLAFDEMFASQLSLQLIRYHHRMKKRNKIENISNDLLQQAIKILPFTLTEDQQKAINEIQQDIYSKNRMNRLLQGDVGSGKTIVAFLTSLIAIENGYQVAFMAPTEILAYQHYNSLKEIANDINVNMELLTGKTYCPKKEKNLS